jgi:ribosomal protein L32
MGTRVCSKCKKLFFSNGRDICLECIEFYHSQEDIVFEYLSKRKEEVTLEQLNSETKVSLNILMDMFHRGSFIGRCIVASQCEICGERIYQGKICKKCATELCGDIEKKIARKKNKRAARSQEEQGKSRFYSNFK